MAKSLRSKVKKRWRALKKNYLADVKVKPELDQISKKLEATIVGAEYRQPESKNAFLHPQDSTAEFPQWAPKKNIDLRSTSIPNSGREYSGASRKHVTSLPSVHQTSEGDMREQQIAQEDRIQDQTKHLKTTIKKDKNRKSKLRKTMVF